MMPLWDRFKRHVMLLDDSDDSCWIWVGATMDDGRGKIKVAGKLRSAHRVAWEFFNGRKLVAGLRLKQECAHPQCVRHWRPDRPWRKLSNEQVRQIRFAESVPSHALAVRYGVSAVYIRKIRAKMERWPNATRDNGNGRACA